MTQLVADSTLEDWDAAAVRIGREQFNGKLLLLAVSVSLLLHASIAAVFLNVKIGAPAESPASVVQIQLFPSNPLQQPDIPQQPLPEQELAPLLPEPVVEELTEESSAPVEEIAKLVESVEPEIQQSPPAIAPDIPQIVLPSIVSIKESLDSASDAKDSRLWSYDCNRLEEDSGIHNCDEKDRRNYRVVESNPAYEALNPIRQLARGQRTARTVASNAPALAARLRASDIPTDISDYVLEQLEAGITHNSNVGNRSVQHMILMTDKSAAAAQARQVLGDAWVKTQAVELQQRKVHVR